MAKRVTFGVVEAESFNVAAPTSCVYQTLHVDADTIRGVIDGLKKQTLVPPGCSFMAWDVERAEWHDVTYRTGQCIGTNLKILAVATLPGSEWVWRWYAWFSYFIPEPIMRLWRFLTFWPRCHP